jgi:phosphatidylethanolamine-binding protein (PEBP) family uncharacterized protein
MAELLAMSIRRLSAVLLAGLALAGCGESSARPRTAMETGSRRPGASSLSTVTGTSMRASGRRAGGSAGHLPAVAIGVSVPTLLPPERIPVANTCDGADRSLAVRWTGVPSGTAEVAAFILSFKPVHRRLFFDWAVAGLGSATRGISAGTLPLGAVVGRNSFGRIGYSICPSRGEHEAYIVRVLALPRPLAAKPGFDAEALYLAAERMAGVVGFTGATYRRP